VATPRAICFDLDGTLFDHHGSARVGVTRFLQGFGVEVTEAAIGAWFTAEDEQFERWRSGAISFREQRRARLRTVLPHLGIEVPGDEAGLDAVFKDYLRAYREAWRLFPESLPLLHELRASGHRLGLLTNGTESQQLDKLARTGLADAFDVVCVSERIGFQKPDVRAFHTLAGQLGVDPTDCLFVGDDPERDVAGARAAGMRAVLVDHAQPETRGLRARVLSSR
jgi:putative hydrolase of the HAD superfamily